jgi:hypothetical protein
MSPLPRRRAKKRSIRVVLMVNLSDSVRFLWPCVHLDAPADNMVMSNSMPREAAARQIAHEVIGLAKGGGLEDVMHHLLGAAGLDRDLVAAVERRCMQLRATRAAHLVQVAALTGVFDKH